MKNIEELKNLIDPHKEPDKEFFLELLDGDAQRDFEEKHLKAVMAMLKALYLNALKNKIDALKSERSELTMSPDYDAEKFRRVLEINAKICSLTQKRNSYKPFFEEPYFGRMDLTDPKEGYNSYYIGKHGDEGLEIVDWRAPLARKYYQKSRTQFTINDYEYSLVLRRALRTRNGKLLDMKNEYLSLSGYLTPEEIGGRDETLIFDPFLREILSGRKDKREICDIIETIQEKQYEIITLPRDDMFVLQGVAGSGKTMIMLHRLSYIMYNDESVKPSDVLVVTPSDSFNDFIDELSAILELEKVKTSTLDSYYLNMLKSIGLDLTKKTDYGLELPQSYLNYVYSPKFSQDIQKRLSKIYDGVFGMLASADAAEAVDGVLSACDRQILAYEKIKNASLRIRRLVLGEIKEKPDGGLYYTKQFRYMFNCVLDVKEFLGLVSRDERMKGYAFFYRQFLSFFKSIKFLRRYSEKICATALDDLARLKETVSKEIADLRRYKIKMGDSEILTYSTGIEKREKLLKEIDEIYAVTREIQGDFYAAHDFTDVLRGDEFAAAIGKCESTVDVLRFFYRETVKKWKVKMGAPTQLNRTDPFALCLILVKLGYDLSPKYSFLFVDEAQDISPAEYEVLRAVNDRAIFNIFGDLKQNITPECGISDWAQLGYETYSLNLNYRNTNEIVEYVSRNLGIEMASIGLNGCEVKSVDMHSLSAYFADKNGLKAIICSEKNLEKFAKKNYNLLGETGKISKSAINIMTVYQSKGLEFTTVAVADGDMTPNEKYIAYTRALKELAIIK